MRAFDVKPRSARVAQRGDPRRSSGLRLDAGTRAFAEPRFGHDFSQVRVHVDRDAAKAAASVEALAFTRDRDIVFAAGEYAPHTPAGRRLLFHELTHVVQQRSGVRLHGVAGRAGDAYEAQADTVAERVAQGAPAGPLLAAAPQVQLQGAAHKKPQTGAAQGDPKMEMLRSSFQKMLKEQKELEDVNRPVAQAIAQAYVDRPKPIHATQYIDDRVQPGPAAEPGVTEVYQAIVGALDVSKSGKEWAWRPLHDPNEGKRDDALTEIAAWGASELIGGNDVGEVILDQKDKVIEYSAKWALKKGLTATAMILTGAGEIIAVFELVFSLAELLKTLKKPLKRPLYKNEILLRQVMQWMAGEQAKAAAQEKDAQERAAIRESFDHPSLHVLVPDKLRIGP